MMPVAYTLSPADLEAQAGTLANQYFSLLVRTQQWLLRLNDFGMQAIAEAVAATGAATAEQDATDLLAMIGALHDVIAYATTSSSAQTVTDNTTGTADQTVTVPAGALAVVTHDPELIALHRSAGTDKSIAIRKLCPPTV